MTQCLLHLDITVGQIYSQLDHQVYPLLHVIQQECVTLLCVHSDCRSGFWRVCVCVCVCVCVFVTLLCGCVCDSPVWECVCVNAQTPYMFTQTSEVSRA